MGERRDPQFVKFMDYLDTAAENIHQNIESMTLSDRQTDTKQFALDVFDAFDVDLKRWVDRFATKYPDGIPDILPE